MSPLSACLLLTVAPVAGFFPGSSLVPARMLITPRSPSALVGAASPVMAASATASAIAWPDATPTPSMDQPIRARIVAVAPRDVASPFEDRGKAAPWFEVRDSGRDSVAECERGSAWRRRCLVGFLPHACATFFTSLRTKIEHMHLSLAYT